MKGNSPLRAFSSVTAVLLVSKLLGFVKQMVTAGVFGATIETDLIQLSQSFVGNIQYVIVQVLLTAFTAVYIHVRERDEAAAKRLAADTMKVFSLAAVGLSVAVASASAPLARIIAPSYGPEQSARLAGYIRLFSPVLVLFVWTAVSHALLNADRRFIPGEMTGLNQSVAVITLVLLLKDTLGVQVLALAFFVYTLWNAVFLGVLSRKSWGRSAGNPFRSEAVAAVLKMAGPLLIGYSMIYVNQQVDKILSSGLETGTVTALGYAAVLNNLVGTFIVSFSSILFTYITVHISKGEDELAAGMTMDGASLLILAFLPVSILTVLCARDIVSVVFERGAFHAQSARIAGFALAGYGFTFVPLVLKELFSRFQYGYQDSKAPTVNSCIGIGVNIALSILLCRRWGVFGITLASSIAAAVCGILNAITSRRVSRGLSFAALLRRVPLMLAGGGVCTAASLWVRGSLSGSTPLVRFAATALCGLAAYFAVTAPLLWRLFRQIRGRNML